MSQYITIDEGNKDVVLKSNLDFKEELKMSLINMAMNIGYFKIKISVNKDEELKREKIRRRIEHEQRINEALEKRENLIFYYNMQDPMM
ncbi:hypothetical protein R9X47_23750 [Wukongibacter baidiensis]|uniref:hypothetical protein n=1 Tax=Wukongibacter baidiensis TaxID=1723361 RepID=UPI003D7F7AC0